MIAKQLMTLEEVLERYGEGLTPAEVQSFLTVRYFVIRDVSVRMMRRWV